ncbi:hypothetical protein [Terricaulis sp.]|uniref:hypothetical protein n=1 Tax=Terricaulis sp. TaxID=2768686 RepID=UPI003783D4E5
MSDVIAPAKESATAKRPAKRPAKRWRNLYWIDYAVQAPHRMYGPGYWWASMTWPSRDIAESIAQGFLERNEDLVRDAGLRYEHAEEDPDA